jgi:hypothetical protein
MGRGWLSPTPPKPYMPFGLRRLIGSIGCGPVSLSGVGPHPGLLFHPNLTSILYLFLTRFLCFQIYILTFLPIQPSHSRLISGFHPQTGYSSPIHPPEFRQGSDTPQSETQVHLNLPLNVSNKTSKKIINFYNHFFLKIIYCCQFFFSHIHSPKYIVSFTA